MKHLIMPTNPRMILVQFLIFIVFVFLTVPLHAQLLKKLAVKGENMAADAGGTIAEKKLQEQLKGKPVQTKEDGNGSSSRADTAQHPDSRMASYSKFDFVPGEKIIFFEDFQEQPIGELPPSFNASGKGEVRTLSNHPGKWLRLFQNTTYLTGTPKTFGENYTIEFDLVYYFQPGKSNYALPGWNLGIFSSNGSDPTGNSFLQYRTENNAIETRFEFSSYVTARTESYLKRTSSFKSDRVQIGRPADEYNKIRHVAVQVQKSRFRLWIDEVKIFDIPRAVNAAPLLNGVSFVLEGSNYPEEEAGLLISNLKIASGGASPASKLTSEGHLTTTGIQFKVNSAVIQDVSYPVLKDIAMALTENPEMKIQIVGHTDSDGNAATNQKLSEQRANAVAAMLSSDFGISAGRMLAIGKGQTEPVSKEKTALAKAMNRRVEFKRL